MCSEYLNSSDAEITALFIPTYSVQFQPRSGSRKRFVPLNEFYETNSQFILKRLNLVRIEKAMLNF